MSAPGRIRTCDTGFCKGSFSIRARCPPKAPSYQALSHTELSGSFPLFSSLTMNKRWSGAHGAGAPVSAVCIKPAVERCLPPHRCARRWLQGWIASPLAGSVHRLSGRSWHSAAVSVFTHVTDGAGTSIWRVTNLLLVLAGGGGCRTYCGACRWTVW